MQPMGLLERLNALTVGPSGAQHERLINVRQPCDLSVSPGARRGAGFLDTRPIKTVCPRLEGLAVYHRKLRVGVQGADISPGYLAP